MIPHLISDNYIYRHFPIKMIFFTCFILISFAIVEMLEFIRHFTYKLSEQRTMRPVNTRTHLCIIFLNINSDELYQYLQTF